MTPLSAPSKEVERYHFWPNCFEPGCLYCLWWDICWALADNDIRVVPPSMYRKDFDALA